jgi:hypothetical protein
MVKRARRLHLCWPLADYFSDSCSAAYPTNRSAAVVASLNGSDCPVSCWSNTVHFNSLEIVRFCSIEISSGIARCTDGNKFEPACSKTAVAAGLALSISSDFLIVGLVRVYPIDLHAAKNYRQRAIEIFPWARR